MVDAPKIGSGAAVGKESRLVRNPFDCFAGLPEF